MRQDIFCEPGYPFRAGEVGKAQLEMLGASSLPLFELLAKLIGCAVDLAIFSEARAAPGDRFSLLCRISNRDTEYRPRLGNLVEIPANGLAVPPQDIELVLEILDRPTLEVPSVTM